MTGELTVQSAHGRLEHEMQPSHRNEIAVRRLFPLFPRKHKNHQPAVVGLKKLLEDAEYLLDYAAESGIKLDENKHDKEMVQTIVSARALEKASERLSDEKTVKAIAAVTNLSAKLKPVSAKTLRACRDDADRTVRTYRRIAIVLGLFLLVSSICSFITSRLSNVLGNDITVANELAITLNAITTSAAAAPETTTSLNADPRNMTNLQQFVTTIRDLQRVSHQLKFFVLAEGSIIGDLEVALPVDILEEVRKKIPLYQQIRSFAKDVQERTALFYGALSNFLLPPLYAILGACAYLLRSFSEQVKARTFLPSRTDSARFIIAAIGGGAVGLFNNFTLGENFPPLAIAFLVGYATDIFFSFLDSLQQTFTKAKPS